MERSELRRNPPIGMTVAEWDETLDWASKQHAEFTTHLPDEADVTARGTCFVEAAPIYSPHGSEHK